MPQPFQYVAPTAPADVANAGMQGMQFGAALAQRNVALDQQRIQMQRQQEQRADLSALAAKGTPSAADYATLVLKYPELKDSFKQSWEALSTEQRQQKLDASAPVYSALQSGRADLAQTLLQRQVDALKNSGGSPADIRAAETWLGLVKDVPQHAQNMGGVFLASVMGPDKFQETFGKLGSEARENAAAPGKRAETASITEKNVADAAAIRQKTPAEVANLTSQATERIDRLAFDRDKLATETGLKIQELTQKAGTLTDDARKLINESASSSVIATNSAVQMRGLADQFEKADPHSFGGGALEGLKGFAGSQDYVTQLRKEYTRIRAGQVNALLPPGPASDRDIENAQAGFLKDTAEPKEIASWLRGVAKLQDYQSQYEDARAQWVASVGHLGKAQKDIDIGGVKVPAGTTLLEYAKKILKSPGPATQAPQPGAKTDYMRKYGTAGVPG